VNEKNEKNDALLALLKEWRERPNTCTQEESDAYDRMLEEMRQERDYRYTREDMERERDKGSELGWTAGWNACFKHYFGKATLESVNCCPANPYRANQAEEQKENL
jgi:hypothetical protein